MHSCQREHGDRSQPRGLPCPEEVLVHPSSMFLWNLPCRPLCDQHYPKGEIQAVQISGFRVSTSVNSPSQSLFPHLKKGIRIPTLPSCCGDSVRSFCKAFSQCLASKSFIRGQDSQHFLNFPGFSIPLPHPSALTTDTRVFPASFPM